MGHNTLGVIPRNVKWQRVVQLLGEDASVGEIVAASAAAAERDLLAAAKDPVVVEAVRLLLAIPAAARADDFGIALRQAELPVRGEPALLDLILAATARLDEIKRSTNRNTDLGELAGRALSTTLTQCIGDRLPGLFETTPKDVRIELRRMARSADISILTRSYFTNLTQSALSYWLERALADHAGPGARFSGPNAREGFDAELRGFAFEATRIIKEFSGGWYAKHLHETGGFSTHDAATFGAVCLKKIMEELRVRWSENA